jgi:hypothetical protein
MFLVKHYDDSGKTIRLSGKTGIQAWKYLPDSIILRPDGINGTTGLLKKKHHLQLPFCLP